MKRDDLVAFRIMRRVVNVKPGQSLNQQVWRTIRKDDGGIAGAVKDLEKSFTVHGLCWMMNPHEMHRVVKFMDITSDTTTGGGAVSVWVYAILPRGAVMLKKLGVGRSARTKAYCPEKFAGHQFPA